MEKLYAFCVKKVDISGCEHYFDGTLTSNVDLSFPKNYIDLKASIGRAMTPQREGNDLIVLSLTVIG